jgi:hypothetical protein
MGQFDDGKQADVLLTSLNCAYVVSVQVGHLREFLLRKTTPQPKLPETLSENERRVCGHPAMIQR